MTDAPRCGTCNYFDENSDESPCSHPKVRDELKPSALLEFFVNESDGDDCPCYERREP